MTDLLVQRKIGINFNTRGEAEILVWAPGRHFAQILINDETWVELLPIQYGYWYNLTTLIKPGDQYMFVLDKKEKFPDPAALAQPDVHGNSIAVDLHSYHWKDDNWVNHPLHEYVIYEIHTSAFTDDGTFAGIEQKLDHLKELGINAIELMPVAQFPGKFNWGYDGVFPYAVESGYGGVDGLRHLVNTCHQKGMAVILDVVYNHLGPDGNYLGKFGPYFTDKYKTPWGAAVNFDDAGCDGVRNFFVENAMMWLRDFHIDALRFDAVHAIRDFSPQHILKEIRLKVDRLMMITGRTYYLIVESDLNDTRFINRNSDEGYGMDAQWADDFHHALRVTAGHEKSGYYMDFEGIADLEKSYRNAYVYEGQYSQVRQKSFGSRADEYPASQFIVFSQNHDQVGNRKFGERTGTLVSFEMQKLLAGAVICSPYIPLLFMGEEWGETSPFLYFADHREPLAGMIRDGRRKEFADAYRDQDDAPDPADPDTFSKSKLNWALKENGLHKTIFGYYKYLLELRKKMTVFRYPSREHMEVQSDQQKNVLMLKRWYADQQVVCIMNFSKEEQQTLMPSCSWKWKKILGSAEPEWGGKTHAPNVLEAGNMITLQPESILIYSCCYV